MNIQNKKGFTLVELAIVLVIIGLLVGGVLQGQELIRQAQIRNIMAQVASLDASVNTFKAKYNQIPGDFSQAVAFDIHQIPNTTTANTEETFTGVDEDGDGDGSLDAYNAGGTDDGFATLGGEALNFWAHLSNVGLTKGAYNGLSALAAGTSYPTLPLGGGVIALSNGSNLNYVMGVAADANLDAAPAATGSTFGNNLTPEEAFSLDSKLDDGIPTSGGVQVVDQLYGSGSFAPTGTGDAADCHLNTNYNVGLTTRLCTIRVRASS